MVIPNHLKLAFCGVADALAGLSGDERKKVLHAAFELVALAGPGATRRRRRQRPRRCSVCNQAGHDARNHPKALGGGSSKSSALASWSLRTPRPRSKPGPKKQKREHKPDVSNGIGAN